MRSFKFCSLAVILIASPLTYSNDRMVLSCQGEYVGVVTKSIRTVTSGFGQTKDTGSFSGQSNGTPFSGQSSGSTTSSLDTNSVTTYQDEKRETSAILIDVAEDGWIQIPSNMLPTAQKLFTKKENKWKFKKFSITQEQISGAFSFNWINRPKFTISGLTGQIDMNILGATFQGNCKKLDLEDRAF